MTGIAIEKEGLNPSKLKAGVNLVAEWTVALELNCANDSRATQLSCSLLTKQRRYCSNTWLTCSVWPSDSGW